MSLDSAEKRAKKGSSPALLLIPLLILAAVGAVLWRLHEGEPPQITFAHEPQFLGSKSTISFKASDAKSGLASLHVALIQGQKTADVYDQKLERRGWFSSAGPNVLEASFQVEPKTLGFAQGNAELVVTAHDFSWRNFRRGNVTTLTIPVVIDTRPPLVSVLNATRYIRNGGSGVVVYRTDEPAGRHGVVVNDNFNPGYPLAGQPENTYVAYVAVPHQADSVNAYVTAVDKAGNEARVPVPFIFKKKEYRNDTLEISDSFLNSKMPEFQAHYDLSGTPVEQFIEVNNRVRKENNAKIKEVCSISTSERLWKGAFLQMARSSRRAGYADHRTYTYQGKEIDNQYHLGLDLASTAHANVDASNRGKVVFADYLGIYGNAVILDHGQGVFSLYGHMSQIKVKVGDLVEQGGLLGQSGFTGMAGGDHLHFSILVNGLFVDPVEWLDPHWLQVSIDDFVKPAAAQAAAGQPAS
ncbi:MAG: M23 family metallopeptidase [Desulfobacteraceae bacterium]|nr:M23 family metallopeptidase [Desulfobacteraceae bacterium]